MIRVTCPTGCSIPPHPVPFRQRQEPIQCRNCRAWYRVPEKIEDGALCEGEQLARPGSELPAVRRARASRAGVAAVAAGLVAGALGVAAVALAARGLVHLSDGQAASIWALGGVAAMVPVGAGAAVGRFVDAGRRVAALLVGAGTGVGGSAWFVHGFSPLWPLVVAGVAGALLAWVGSALPAPRVRV